MIYHDSTSASGGDMGNLIRFLKVASSHRQRTLHSVKVLLGVLISSGLVSNFGASNAVSGLVFRSELLDYNGQQGRSLLGPGGVILDIPKIRVVRYKVRSSDPNVVSDELDCDNSECGDIVELPASKQHLGTNSAKEMSEWSIPANVTQLVIECKSRSGVVEWEYEGNGVMSDIEIENNRIVGDFWASSTYLHISLLTFNSISDTLTGKYTCKNLDKTTKSNSFYLFAPQPRSEVINDGRKIEVTPPSHADEVVLPCRMDKRQTPIYLFRKSPDGNYRRMSLQSRGRFDPYLGFVLPVTPDVFGEYACKVDKKRRKKSKRDAPSLAMMPPTSQTPESIQSPGFSAFPNSAELAEIIKTDNDAAFLASLLTASSGEQATVPPDMAFPPVPTVKTNASQDVQEVASFMPYKHKGDRPHHGRRRKRPFLRRRHRPGEPSFVGSPALTRRGGPPHHGHMQMPHRPGFMMHRRPVYRRPPGPLMGSPNLPPVDHSAPSMLPAGSTGSLSLPAILNQPLHPPHFHNHHGSHQKLQHVLHSNSSPHSAFTSNGEVPPGLDNLEKFPGSYEAGLSQTGMLSPHQAFIAETLMSRVDVSKTPANKPPVKKPVSLFPQNLLPPTMTVVHTMQCVLKKMVLGADAPCNASLADGIAERHGSQNNPHVNSVTEGPFTAKEQKTILEIALLPPPANKFYPVKSAIFTTAPFFVKWETRFTDYANWAQVNHTLKEGAYKRHHAEEVADFENGINALEVFGVPDGETGNITITYMGGRKEIKTHTWHYYIINSTTFNNKGLKQTVDGVVKVFMCRSTTSKRPTLSLSRLTENGCPQESKDPFSGTQDYTEEDCGSGCTLLRTKIEQGVVTCTGDGVDQTVMFPDETQCTGRPYFMDRGKTKNVTLAAKGGKLVIPCVINNPNADVYLFHEENGVMTEVTDNSMYDLKQGFSLNTAKIHDPYGNYICTSSADIEDTTDMVRYRVSPPEEYVFYPPYETVFGAPPFKFMWESNDELEVVNASIGKFDKGMFAKTDGTRPHVGTFEVLANATEQEGSFGEVQVRRISDGKILHTWRFRYFGKIGLTLDKEKNLFRCQAATDNPPMLYAVPCDNPNVCKLERKHSDEEDEDIRDGRENSQCGPGCVQLKIWRNKPLGFVRCKGDGVDETLQYFLTENSTILTEEDNSKLEQFKLPEIMNGVRRLRVGESADFVCKANRYFYSKGFQWAIETKNGQKKFIDAKVREDVFVKDEIRSVISLKILDAEWKSVWCYTPELMSNHWSNISQPIYLR